MRLPAQPVGVISHRVYSYCSDLMSTSHRLDAYTCNIVIESCTQTVTVFDDRGRGCQYQALKGMLLFVSSVHLGILISLRVNC